MPNYVEIRIASDGDSRSTQVIVDGKHIQGVKQVTWTCKADNVALAVIEVSMAPIYAIGQLERTRLICQICGHSSQHECELPEIRAVDPSPSP